MNEQLPPIAQNPLNDRSGMTELEMLREDIQIGQELLNSPNLLRFLYNEYQTLTYKINHLQPATETDRDVVFAITTANAKLAVLEKMYNFALKLPIAVASYEAITADQTPEQ